MVAQADLGRSTWLLVVVLLLVLSSCSLTERLTVSEPGPEVYYTMPPVTYIREFPGYASRIVDTVYRGEQVTILSRTKGEWCRVQTPGNQPGWMPYPLLSPVPVRVETYYVQAAEVPLREEPHKEVISRKVLYRGAEVRKLAENDQGWWRVLVVKDKSLGWLPAETVAASQETSPGEGGLRPEEDAAGTASLSRPAAKQFFVAITSLELHLLPLASSPVVKVLHFNEEVEEVYRSDSQWLKVRYPETGVQGWTLASYLSDSAGKEPKPVAGRKHRGPRGTGRRDLKKEQVEELEPEIM